jgi:histidinol-phosphate aminotransferase
MATLLRPAPAAPPAGPAPNPWVEAIAAYVPGRAALAAGGRPPAKLSANENPLGPAPAALEAAAATLARAHLYPDGASTALREALGAKYGLDPARILCGAGSDELLQLAATAFAGPGDEVLFARHSFAVYPIAAQRVGAVPVEAPDRDWTADVDALLAAVTPRTRILFLANPNNPTGTMLPATEVARLHAGLRPDILLVLDSAYAEYLDRSDYGDGLALSLTAPNVLTTRTFSKIHALAALRVGWCHGPAPVIAAMDKVRGPFNTTTAGIAAAVAALADDAAVERARAHNRQWRDWLFAQCAGLANHGIRAVPSVANFVMLVFPREGALTAGAAFHALAEAGYMTRWLRPQGMEECLRISVGTAEETQGVAAALRAWVETMAC